MMRRRFPAALGLLLGSLSSASFAPAPAAAANKTQGEDAETQAEAPDRPAEMPLSLLPEPPSLELAAPRPRALEAIDAVLGRIISSDPAARERALGELVEVRSDWVSGLARRIDRIAERSDKPAMRALLERLRSRQKHGADEDEAGGDYLKLVLDSPSPDSETWRDLTQILAISRMLRHIGTADAVRELIRVYVRCGEFLRINTQRELDALGDRQIAGLYEARRHQAPKIAAWAEKRLDLLGKAIPHEAVRTKDAAALADILVALGRSRDADAGRVLISFAATERSQVRLAARQGIALLGDLGAWQLRDAYQDTTGKQAPRDWTWKRTARELFTEFDRVRSAKEFELFEAAQKAEKAGQLAEMRDGYDQVLALSPLFEQRELMASGYMKFADSMREKDPPAAMAAYRRVERIAKETALRNRAESQRHTLEAQVLAATGMVDRGLLDKAVALDPENDEARNALEGTALTPSGLSARARYLLAAAVGGFSLLGSGWIAWVALRRRKAVITEEPAPTAEPPAAEELPSEEPPATDEPPEELPSEGPPGAEPPAVAEAPSADEAPATDEPPPNADTETPDRDR